MRHLLIIDFGSLKTPLIEEMVYEFADYTTVPFHALDPTTFTKFNGFILSSTGTCADTKPDERVKNNVQIRFFIRNNLMVE